MEIGTCPAKTAVRSTDEKQVINIRLPRWLTDEVRALAQRDSESHATTLRRLLRIALKHERTHHNGNEAA